MRQRSADTASVEVSAAAVRDERAADALAALSVPDRAQLLELGRQLARTRRTPWTADDLREVALEAGLDMDQPTLSGGPWAMGGVFLTLKCEGTIRPVGYTVSRRPARRGVCRLWIGREVQP
ncbi:hypothetical protein [Euzebya sp.]|uniref:hypothetical protein n=1 Tax=Euzebya sp. TaxID=1971409 RepID=UPI0035110920